MAAEVTVATEVLPLLHTPPGVASDSLIIDPWHTLDGPVIVPALGSGFTATTNVADTAPQPLEIV